MMVYTIINFKLFSAKFSIKVLISLKKEQNVNMKTTFNRNFKILLYLIYYNTNSFFIRHVNIIKLMN
jgi:hypothetical protein